MHIRLKIESYSGVLHAPDGAHADLVDVSLGGIGFVTREPMSVAKDVYVSFTLPDLNGAPFVFHVKGDLVHSTPMDHYEGYLNGLVFNHLTLTQDEVLRHYMALILANLKKSI